MKTLGCDVRVREAPSRARVLVSRSAAAIAVVAALAGCLNLPSPTYPSAEAFVASELASLAPAASYDHVVVDLADSTESPRGVEASGVEFTSLTRNIGFERGVAVAGDEAPAEGRFVGSTEHLRLRGAGSIRLPATATVLGMHVALTHRDALEHRWIPADTDARLLVRGLRASGGSSGTVKVSPAISNSDGTEVAEQWIWVDLSILGPVNELELTFESPLSDLPVILIDNLTYSANFRPDPGFFTIALLPPTAPYMSEDAEIFGAQVRYLREEARARDGEPIAYVSHLGGFVQDGEDEEQWELVDDTMRLLDGALLFGTSPAATDMADPEDPELGSPFYLETFSPARFRVRNPSFEASEDEYSSFQVFTTPVGNLLSLHLSVDPMPETIEWAKEVLYEYRDTPTMITLPAYMEVREGVVTRRTVPAFAGTSELWPGASAQQVWEDLVWPNDQVFLVASGEGRYEATAISWNRAELPVIEMLAAYSARPAGGEGYLRLLRFYPGRSEVRAITYSPWLDTYEQDPNSEFRLPLDISGRLGLE